MLALVIHGLSSVAPILYGCCVLSVVTDNSVLEEICSKSRKMPFVIQVLGSIYVLFLERDLNCTVPAKSDDSFSNHLTPHIVPRLSMISTRMIGNRD